MADVDEEKIRTLAYQLWERAGSPPEGEEDFWNAAKQLLADEGEINDPDDPMKGLPIPPILPPAQ